jgi:hypothetical protein
MAPPPAASPHPSSVAHAPTATAAQLAATAKTVEAAVQPDARAVLDAAYEEGLQRRAPASPARAQELRSTLQSAKSVPMSSAAQPSVVLPPPAGYADRPNPEAPFQPPRPQARPVDEYTELPATQGAPPGDPGMFQVKSTVRMSPEAYQEVARAAQAQPQAPARPPSQRPQAPAPYPVGLQRRDAQSGLRATLEGMSATTVLLIGMGAGVVFVVVVLAALFIATHH